MSDGTNLEAAFARLEGVVTTEIKHLAQDVRTLTQRLEAYPTKRDLDAVEARVNTLEDGARWIWRTGVTFALGVIGSALVAWIKLSH